MSVSESYREYVVDQLGRIVAVTTRHMFGGVGIYGPGLFFALIADDRLYFKVDDSNRGEFAERGMGPFMPFGDSQVMQYYEVPGDVLDDLDGLESWVAKALIVARAKRTKKAQRAKRR